MTSDFKNKIFKSSSMLPTLLSNLDAENLGWCTNVLEADNVQDFLKDEELVHTADIFFENNLNISKTSTNGFMHRNTLLYRIEKIEKMLGLDIRKFEDAVTMEIILVLHNQQKRSKKTKKN